MSHVGYNSKPAKTYYNVIKHYKNCSLTKVKIITGRTHQIRVHLASIGHGLLGDDMYGYQSKFIQRPALHAYTLAFELKKQTFHYKLNPPQDFNELLKHVEQL
jgi:23S rRNA pseudouridine1911/1915/1917 synthase